MLVNKNALKRNLNNVNRSTALKLMQTIPNEKYFHEHAMMCNDVYIGYTKKKKDEDL